MWTDKKTIRSLPSISKHPTVQKEQSCAVFGTATRKKWGHCGPHCKQIIIIEVRSEKRSHWLLQFQMDPRLKPWNYKKTHASLQRPLRSDGPHSLTQKVVTQPQKKLFPLCPSPFQIHVHTSFFFSYSGGTHEHQNERKKKLTTDTCIVANGCNRWDPHWSW